MSNCYAHPDRPAETQCPYCAKSLCEDCLLLHGSLDRVVCTNCFDLMMSRLGGSIKRRLLYVTAGLLLGPVLLYYGYVRGTDTPMAIVGIGCILTVAVNLFRIKCYSEALRSRPYSGSTTESPAAGG